MVRVLPGWKTNINTTIMGLIQIGTVWGLVDDPERAMSLIQEWWGALVVLHGALVGLGAWFRSLANK